MCEFGKKDYTHKGVLGSTNGENFTKPEKLVRHKKVYTIWCVSFSIVRDLTKPNANIKEYTSPQFGQPFYITKEEAESAINLFGEEGTLYEIQEYYVV